MLSKMLKLKKQHSNSPNKIRTHYSYHHVNDLHHWSQALSSIHPAAASFPGVGFSRKASPRKKLFSNSSERIFANISDKLPAALSSAATCRTEARHSAKAAKIVDVMTLLKQLSQHWLWGCRWLRNPQEYDPETRHQLVQSSIHRSVLAILPPRIANCTPWKSGNYALKKQLLVLFSSST